MIRVGFTMLLFASAGIAMAEEPAGLHQALTGLASSGQFSGAVVIRDAKGTRFSRAYGQADPFTGRLFTVDTPVDSGSLAKPVTAALVLAMAADGRIDLDAPAVRYVPQFPFETITIRQLLSHSAGLSVEESAKNLSGKSNLQLVESARGKPPLFPAGSAFSYCNLCSIALAELVERVSGVAYLDLAKTRLTLPAGVGLRPARLADWPGRAIGHRRGPGGKSVRFDSWEGERFYGPANLSVSAGQLAEWGTRWWSQPLSQLRPAATADAVIGGNVSGLTLGNWYCAAGKRRCHYLGHHEGFHHMLYWDADQKLSVAMVSNNALAPGLVQRVQRSLVAFAEGRPGDGRRELGNPLSGTAPAPGRYRMANGESIDVETVRDRLSVRRGRIHYPAYAIGPGIHYVPGLDMYVTAKNKRLLWLTLYEQQTGTRYR